MVDINLALGTVLRGKVVLVFTKIMGKKCTLFSNKTIKCKPFFRQPESDKDGVPN
mgnify:CR=1 FL=1